MMNSNGDYIVDGEFQSRRRLEFEDRENNIFPESKSNTIDENEPVKFSGGVIHQLFLWEVHHNGLSDKKRFILGTHEVRFSKVGFCLITGLRFGLVQNVSRYVNVDNGLRHRYFGGKDEISYVELRDVLRHSEFQQAYNSVKICIIYMLNWILMGLDERVKILV
ncbi:hypothetical protein Ddye_026270 [Dipteronia dyeriana]|uniref:DUF1985 domain-containing protein n=1 Tax=Dipteronia dyeriana TaxID=168575 RepID=A0AAD9WQE1_9ROSI|nr:hypothetical protein Ddye_026270 [Dipteronia dyeriana]